MHLDPTPDHVEERLDERKRSESSNTGLSIVVANEIVCNCTNTSLSLDCESRAITSLDLSAALNGLPISSYCPKLTYVYVFLTKLVGIIS